MYYKWMQLVIGDYCYCYCYWGLLLHMWVNKYSKIVYVDGGNGDVMSWRHRGNVKLIQAVQDLSVIWSYLVCANTVEFYWWSLYLSSISGKFSWTHPLHVFTDLLAVSLSVMGRQQFTAHESIRRMLSGEFSETETLVCHVCCRAHYVCQRKTRRRMGAQISRLPQREHWTLWTDYISLYMLHNPYKHTHTSTHTCTHTRTHPRAHTHTHTLPHSGELHSFSSYNFDSIFTSTYLRSPVRDMQEKNIIG